MTSSEIGYFILDNQLKCLDLFSWPLREGYCQEKNTQKLTKNILYCIGTGYNFYETNTLQ